MPRVGEKLPLSLQLFDNADNMHVRAYLKDPLGVDILLNPVVLNNIGEGLYANDQILMPNTEIVFVTYIVYKDALFEKESPLHSTSQDVFVLDLGIQEIVNRLINLQSDVSTLLSQGISATLVGYIVDDNIITGSI